MESPHGWLLRGAIRIQQGDRYSGKGASCEYFFQPHFFLFETGIKVLPSDVESDDEEPHHLEIAVAVDEFLQAHPGTLNQKLEYLLVARGITQPIGEVFIRNAIS